MADGAQALLTALQHGDGQFPGGGFAFSWGLEALVAEGRLRRGDFAAYLSGQMAQRWAWFDRLLVGHAHARTLGDAGDALRWQALDERAEAMGTVEAARTGACRAGLALLGSHVRLGTPGAAALRALADQGRVQGHLPVVQGVVLAGTGLGQAAALAVSGYTAASALATAGLRLGLIGHIDAQQALQQVRPLLARLAEAPLPDLDELCSVAPEADLAMMRHADRPQRLFFN